MRFSIRLKKSPKLRKAVRSAGDTLVEVTIALAILSMVLITSTVVATQSYRMGQTARERTAISSAAQGQMEAMRAFRDSHDWSQFLNGGTSPAAYPGVLSAAVGPGCRVKSPCLHMIEMQGNTFVPADGPMSGPTPTSFMEIVIKSSAAPGVMPRTVTVVINYGAESLGGGNGKITGHIQTDFTDMGYIAPTPIPPPPPPCNSGITDIVLVLDTSGSMEDPFGNGNRLNASKMTANGFIDKANIGPNANHIGLVDFSLTAKIDFGLTGDVALAKKTINGLFTSDRTHYVPALALAQQVLNGPGARPGVPQVIVFVSDGQPNDAGSDGDPRNLTMIQTQLDSMTRGIKIFTIGIGNDGNMDILLNVMPQNGGISGTATEPNKLEQIYTNIAGEITCGDGAGGFRTPSPTPFSPI